MFTRQIVQANIEALSEDGTRYDFDDRNDETTWFLAHGDEHDRLDQGGLTTPLSIQHLFLSAIVENGEAVEIAKGFAVPNHVIAALDVEEKALLGLPQPCTGELDCRINGTTTSSNFGVGLTIRRSGFTQDMELDGPFVRLSGGELLTPDLNLYRALAAIRAFEKHRAERSTDEVDALGLVYDLKQLKENGLDIPLGIYEKFSITSTDRVGVTTEDLEHGGLRLRPKVEGVDPEKITARIHQVSQGAERAVLRVADQLVLLESNAIAGLQEVASNEIISAKNAKLFKESPSAFLDATVVDLDDFSTRVLGIGPISSQSAPEQGEYRQEWFGDDGLPFSPLVLHDLVTDEETFKVASDAVGVAQGSQLSEVVLWEKVIDIHDQEMVDQVFEEIAERLQLGEDPGEKPLGEGGAPRPKKIGLITEDADEDLPSLTKRANSARPSSPIRYDDLRRQPFPHQKSGIEWMAGLLEAAYSDDRGDMYRLSGALLADDMGLGKSYMTLVALREALRLDTGSRNEPRPVLGVVPVTLLDNWASEIDATFVDSPFSDVVILHGRGLARFKAGKGKETELALKGMADGDLVDPSEIRYSLKFGESFGQDRLDQPGRLVLTTYETLRQYQFSLGAIDWAVAFFDEAQKIKEPSTGVTRAARAIKSGFTLLCTGTPVENSLRNIHTLFDIAQPGLLGSWSEFRKNWITPTLMLTGEHQREMRMEYGQKLRNHIGAFMLRRTKEDELEGLPTKTIHTALKTLDGTTNLQIDEWLAGEMSRKQERVYDSVLSDYKSTSDKRGAALPTLKKLRDISLHPDLYAREDTHWVDASSPEQAIQVMEESGRFVAMLKTIDQIRLLDEKVIVFAISRKLLFSLKVWFKALYGLDVSIVNGETKAVATSANSAGQTRSALIKKFEAKDGFNIILMSPLAAGTGLTVVGANHVIHLERHWNPAKEDQATDRVYRIGQTRPVHVYLPSSRHSRFASFDDHLNELILAKTDVKNAVVTPEYGDEDRALSSMFAVLEG